MAILPEMQKSFESHRCYAFKTRNAKFLLKPFKILISSIMAIDGLSLHRAVDTVGQPLDASLVAVAALIECKLT